MLEDHMLRMIAMKTPNHLLLPKKVAEKQPMKMSYERF